MLANVVHMPPPVHLTDEDLEIAERAAHRLAERYRQAGDLKRAEAEELMAQRVERARDGR
jgi:hypothetical protein